MAIREGRWDCPSCGAVAQLGRNVDCSQCGAPRPQGVRFYLPSDDEPVVTDTERLREAKAGPDWVCEHCGGSARATQNECPGCGAPRGGSAAREVRDYDTAHVPHSAADAKPADAKPADGKKKDDGSAACGCCGCLVLIVLLLALLGWCGGSKDEKPGGTARPAVSQVDSSRREHYDPFTRVVVVDRRWTRSVPVEELRQLSDEGQSVPSDGEVVSRRRGVVGHHQELDHYETKTRHYSERVKTGEETYVCGQRDLGNGYFEDRTCTRAVYGTETRTESERVPVYRDEDDYGTIYTYRVWRWVPDTTLASMTHGTTPPAWPRVRRSSSRRTGPRQETLEVEVAAGGQHWTVPVTPQQYPRFLVGDSVRIVLADGGAVQHLLPIWRGSVPPPVAAGDTSGTATAASDSAEAPRKPRATRPRRRPRRTARS